MAYLDDIIIYLNTEEEYKEHIKWVLKRLYDENIPIIIEKCEFHIRKTNFVGFIIKPRQISIDLKMLRSRNGIRILLHRHGQGSLVRGSLRAWRCVYRRVLSSTTFCSSS